MKANAWKAVVFIGSLVSASLFVSAFYLVLVRSDISEDAQAISKLEYRLLKAQDALRALEVTVDDSIQPHVLKARIDGVLELPREGQVVRVQEQDLENFDSEKWIAKQAVHPGKEGV